VPRPAYHNCQPNIEIPSTDLAVSFYRDIILQMIEKQDSKEKARARDKRIKQRRKEQGLCLRCGYEKDSTGHEHCTAREKDRREKYLQAGVCRSHSKRIAISSSQCEECWFRARARTALGDRKEWKTLKDLFTTQNNLCAYTGKVLIAGDNASVDHKIPETRGGTKTLPNVHFVDKIINKLKTWLTHDEFLLICKGSWEKSSLDDPTSQVLAQIHRYLNGLEQRIPQGLGVPIV